MAVREDSRLPTKSELEKLTLGEICLSLIDRTIAYSMALSKGDKKGAEDYMQKIRPLVIEIDRREQLYLEGHRANQRY